MARAALTKERKKPTQMCIYYKKRINRYWCIYMDLVLPGFRTVIYSRVISMNQVSTFINSSPPSDEYMRRWTGSALVQVMACRLFGAKPLPESMLPYCQLDLKNKLHWNSNTKLFIQENSSENVVCEMAAILFREGFVNAPRSAVNRGPWGQKSRMECRSNAYYSDVIMNTIASQITGVSIVYSTVCSGADQRNYQSSTSLAFVRGIHRWPVNSPYKRPVTRKTYPFDDIIMNLELYFDLGLEQGGCWDSSRHSHLRHFVKALHAGRNRKVLQTSFSMLFLIELFD